MSTAWHVEAFARSKRMPKLETILKRARKPAKEPVKAMPEAELYANLCSWAALLNGRTT